MQFINSIHNHFMTRVSWNLRSCGYGAYVTTMETATATVTRTSTEKKRPLIKENKNSGLFQAFRQWRVARNEERRGKKEALSTYSHPSLLTPPPLSLPLPYPSLVFFLTFLRSVPLSERLKQTNFSTFRFRHYTTTKWNFLTSNFKFYGKRRHQMKFLLFFPRTWMRFLRIQLQKYSPRFDKFSRSNVFTAMNFETAQIPFFTLTF